jgi:hypothetical protein
MMIQVPNRITMDQLVEQIGRELGTNIGKGANWKLWKGDQIAAPPLTEGEEYGSVPSEISGKPGIEPVKKRDIDFTSESEGTGKW